jgi:hypothetical protein
MKQHFFLTLALLPTLFFLTAAPAQALESKHPRNAWLVSQSQKWLHESLSKKGGIVPPSVVLAIIKKCRDKRLSDPSATHIGSVHCSNPRITELYQKAHYRYMDLVRQFTAKRAEIANKEDSKAVTYEEGTRQVEKAWKQMTEMEKERDRVNW